MRLATLYLAIISWGGIWLVGMYYIAPTTLLNFLAYTSWAFGMPLLTSPDAFWKMPLAFAVLNAGTLGALSLHEHFWGPDPNDVPEEEVVAATFS